MKFKKDGDVSEDFRGAFSDYCLKQKCLCPVGRGVKGAAKACDGCWNSRPAEAARLTGYEVVEEEPEKEAAP